jgi:pimeloyl-ACP methyl ester carboxylesterase
MLRRIGLWLALALAWAGPAHAEHPFVFVHGAWVGEWYWQPIVDALRAEGHIAIAVSLTGQGLRIAEGGSDVTLDDHIADVVAAITDNDLQDVILVAHSYGGKPATGAWDIARDRIARVVYVEAVAPYTDNPVAIPADTRSLAYLVMSSPDIADTGMLPPSPTLRDEPGKPLAAQSLASLYGTVSLQNGPLPPTPGTFVIGSRSRAPIFREYARRLAALRGWDVVELDAGHDVVKDAPQALIALLLSLR